ncbi:MAG: hypothetical protein PWQ63_253 [Methanolobus sp.]|jgi:FOG: PKD repeat|nr:hypothetical protein [Methanolobus sp.]MDK2947093.1 hypothetical protein [Methanolobus sp.]
MKYIILAIVLLVIFVSPVSAMNWQTETVDDASSYCPYPGPNTGKYTSLAFDLSDNPAISYLYYNSHELKFTHYNNSSWEIETVDDVGQVGLYTSLEFDHSGNPAISYYDWLNGSLKFAYHNGSSWETETVDDAGLVGLHTSYITVVDSPVAGFSSNVISGVVPLSVGFTDSSANDPTSWVWDFGDGNISTNQNPVHTYSTVGTYNVSLNASNALGSSISTRIAYITVSGVSVESSDSGSSSGSSSSSRLSIITTQAQDDATITDNISEEIPEESIQAEKNVSIISEEEKTEGTDTKETDADDIKSTPGFGALAGIVFVSLALIVLRKINN